MNHQSDYIAGMEKTHIWKKCHFGFFGFNGFFSGFFGFFSGFFGFFTGFFGFFSGFFKNFSGKNLKNNVRYVSTI